MSKCSWRKLVRLMLSSNCELENWYQTSLRLSDRRHRLNTQLLRKGRVGWHRAWPQDPVGPPPMMTNFSRVWEPVSTICRSASSYASSTLLRISVASSIGAVALSVPSTRITRRTFVPEESAKFGQIHLRIVLKGTTMAIEEDSNEVIPTFDRINLCSERNDRCASKR